MTTRAVSAAIAFLFFSNSVALADGYRDFNKGVDSALHSDPDNALKYLSAALTETDLPKPLRAPAYLERGYVYESLGQTKLALADYTAAIAAAPDRPDTYVARCKFFIGDKMYKQALADCSSAIDMQPSNWQLHKLRIEIENDLKQYDAAMAEYAPFIVARPHDIRIRLARADLNTVLGKLDDATADANAAVTAAPGNADPFSTLGLIAELRQDFSGAIGYFDKSIALFPWSSGAYTAKGRSQLEMGKYEDATSTFKTVIKRNTALPYAFLGLSIAEARLGATVPDDIVAYYSKAEINGVEGSLTSLYLGRAGPATVLALQETDPDVSNAVRCPASLYVGEWYLIQKKTADAKLALTKARDVCITQYRQWATIELSRLQ